MARVAAGGSQKGAAWYAHNQFVPRGILTDVRTATLSSQAVDTSFPPVELRVRPASDGVKYYFIKLLEVSPLPAE